MVAAVETSGSLSPTKKKEKKETDVGLGTRFSHLSTHSLEGSVEREKRNPSKGVDCWRPNVILFSGPPGLMTESFYERFVSIGLFSSIAGFILDLFSFHSASDRKERRDLETRGEELVTPPPSISEKGKGIFWWRLCDKVSVLSFFHFLNGTSFSTIAG